MRPAARNRFAPARLPSVRGKAFSATDFILTLLTAELARPPAFKFKKRRYRRITMDLLDRLAQKPRDRQGGNFPPPKRRAQDRINCYQFVNGGFLQSFDAGLVQNCVGDARG